MPELELKHPQPYRIVGRAASEMEKFAAARSRASLLPTGQFAG